MMKNITLTKINSPTDDHKIIYDNYLTVYSCARDVVNILVKASWIDPLVVPSFKDYTGSKDNRDYYLWRKKSVEISEKIINRVSDELNKEGLLAPPNYDEMNHLKLWVPEILVYSPFYQSKMNNNFSAVETRINDFYKILEDAKLIN